MVPGTTIPVGARADREMLDGSLHGLSEDAKTSLHTYATFTSSTGSKLQLKGGSSIGAGAGRFRREGKVKKKKKKKRLDLLGRG